MRSHGGPWDRGLEDHSIAISATSVKSFAITFACSFKRCTISEVSLSSGVKLFPVQRFFRWLVATWHRITACPMNQIPLVGFAFSIRVRRNDDLLRRGDHSSKVDAERSTARKAFSSLLSLQPCLFPFSIHGRRQVLSSVVHSLPHWSFHLRWDRSLGCMGERSIPAPEVTINLPKNQPTWAPAL